MIARPIVKSMTVKRNEEAPLTVDLQGIDLMIRSNPPGAQVTLNGTAVGSTPLNLTDQAPGEYRIALTHEGYDTAERTIAAVSKTTVDVPLARTLPKVGTLVVYRESHFIGLAGRPDLRINNEIVCELTNGSYWSAEVPVGDYDVSVKQSLMSPVGTQVQVQMGRATYIQVGPGMTGWLLHPTSEGSAKNAIATLTPIKSSPLGLRPAKPNLEAPK